MAGYTLDHYHFNVRQGDGAIHILAEKPTGGGKPNIKCATLIDAGTGKTDDNYNKLQDFIREDYKRIYNPVGVAPGFYLQFDSIVVSHWDDDHFSGITWMLGGDSALAWEEYQAAHVKKIPYDPANAICKITDAEKEFALSYLNIKDGKDHSKRLWDEVVQTAREIPGFLTSYKCRLLNPGGRRTGFYAPDYSQLKEGDKGQMELPAKGFWIWLESADLKYKTTSPTSSPSKKPKTDKFSRSLALAANSETPKQLSVRIELDWKITNKAGKVVLGPTLSFWCDNVCDVYYEPAETIGRDILTNEIFDGTGDYPSITDRWMLISKHQTKNPGNKYPVGMYCIGIDRSGINFPKDGISKTEVPPEYKSFVIPSPEVPLGSGSGHFGVFMVDDSAKTQSAPHNLQSIITVAIWKDSKAVSHYSAGDADFVKELYALKWLVKLPSPPPTPTPVFQVPNMKLSHHGSATSTPVPLVTNFKPENVIISAGDNAGYQHPRPEVIFYFYAWLILENRTARGQNPIYASQFPFYAVPDYGVEYTTAGKGNPTPGGKDYRHIWDYYTGKKVIPKKLPVFKALVADPNDTKSPDARYIKQLIDVYKEINKTRKPPLKNIQDQFTAWGTKILEKTPVNPDNKREEYDMATWISYQVEEMWKSVSPMFVSDYKSPVYIVIRSTSRGTTHSVLCSFDLKAAEEPSLPRVVTPGPTPTDLVTPIELIAWPEAQMKSLILTETKSGTGLSGKPVVDPSGSTGRSLVSDRNMPIMVRRDAPGDDNNTPYTITSTDASNTPPLTLILSLLHGEKITLENKPDPHTSTKLVQADQWRGWFNTALSATDIFAQTGEDGKVNAFAMSLDAAKLFPGSNVPQLTFSTAQFVTACVQSDLPIELPLGVLEANSTIGFGLDIGKNGFSLHSDLTTVLQYLGFAASNPIADFVGAEIGLTLDGSSAEAIKGARNAVWFTPASSYSTVTRLRWRLDAISQVQTNMEKFMHGVFNLGEVFLITRRTTTYTPGANGEIAMVTIPQALLEVEIKITGKTFLATMLFKQNHIQLQINNNDLNVLSEIIQWLQDSIGQEDIPIVSWLGQVASGILKGIHFRRVTIFASNVEMQVTGFNIQVEVGLIRGASDDNPAPILLTYSATPSKKSGKLRGELWFGPDRTEDPNLLPAYEKSLDLVPITSTNPTIRYLDLANLDGSKKITTPKGIPTIVNKAFVEVTDSALTIGGEITCEPVEPSDVPQISLEVVTLDATYKFSGKGSLDLSLQFEIDIAPPENAKHPESFIIRGYIEYDDGNWSLSAQTSPLYGGALYQFFDPKAQAETLSILDTLQFGGLELEYKYSNGVGSEFTFSGSIFLGDLELDMDYHYTKDEWVISASLSARTENSTINSIIQSITGDENDSDLLPPFVGEIGVGGKNKPAVKLLCTKKSAAKKPPGGNNAGAEAEAGEKPKETSSGDEYLIFSVSISLEFDGGKIPLKATFLQYRDLAWPSKVGPKRLLKFAVTGLPEIDVPAVGNLTQPFDEMFYMWMSSDQPSDAKNPVPGLTEDQVNVINTALDDPRGGAGLDKLVFKVNKKKPGASGGQTAVILPGNHFVLVIKSQGKSEAILDYVFGGTKKSNNGLESRALMAKTGDTPPSDSGSGDDPSLVPYKKQAGAITISNIGFKYKGDSLSVLLDAAFVLGPLSFKLVGFKLILNFTKENNLTNPPFPDFGLDGLAVAFNKPPLTIAGMFIRLSSEELKGYAGGIALGFVPYLFKAAGFYGEVTPKSGGEFTSVFVFAKLEGPLISFAFAEISGITLGFGYNMSMRFPTAENVTSFPLLSSDSFGDNLIDNFTTLIDINSGGQPSSTAWFSIRKDSFWAAAGLKVSAFEILSVDAVVAVEWNPEVKLGIFGVAVADFPKGSTSNIKCHIELGISAVIDLGQGVMKLEAQLSPNSHLFDPNCRLTGGFALYYWFDGTYADKNLIGDWVFTVGGYHRAFSKPAHYPNPPRLGLSWDVGGALKITGEAYFAITPKCCMCGGRLVATLYLGPLKAWFEAFADFLINYKPFYFMADGGISVGVSCKVDLLIVSFTITVELGARLHLEGPPLCGRVHVNFYIMAFDIDFGPQPSGPKELNFRQFYMLVRQVETLPDATEDDPPGYDHVDHSAHIFSVITGLLSDPKKPTSGENDPWVVKGGIFGFQITSRVAMSEVHQPITEIGKEPPQGGVVNSDYPVYARPMKTTSTLASELKISIKRRPDPTEFGARFMALMTLPDQSVENSWGIKPIDVAVPAAIWGKYNPETDARISGNNAQALLDGDKSVVNQMMGVELGSPLAVKEKNKIPKFSAKESMEMSVMPQGEEPIFKHIDDSNPNWAPDQGMNPEARWKQVPEIWKAKAEEQKHVVKIWSSEMGWTEEDFAEFGTPELLLEEERFLNLYLEAPMISVG